MSTLGTGSLGGGTLGAPGVYVAPPMPFPYTSMALPVIVRPTVTMIYDEQFTVDRAATIASNTPFAASHVGNTKLYNHSTSSISGGVFNYASPASSQTMVIDAAAARARLQGRVHYCKHATAAGATDFQSFIPGGGGECLAP